jgi:hypothetical protein
MRALSSLTFRKLQFLIAKSNQTPTEEMPESGHRSVMTATRLNGNAAAEESAHASLVV